MTRDNPAILAEGLEKRFGDVRALSGLDLVAEEGTVLGVLGPNGAGKTTAVRILTTLLKPDAGRATVAGYDVVRQGHEVRPRIGLAGQYAAVDEYLTGWENLEMVGRLYHLDKKVASRRADELLERFDLVDAGKRIAKTYSGGMRRRLDLAASLVAAPPVLFLDEPTTGLDPRSRLALWGIIRDLVSDGTTVLLTTQYLEEADQLADQIVVIDGGHAIARGTSAELKAQVGGTRLEVVVAATGDIDTAAGTLRPHGTGAVHTDRESRHVTVPVEDGAAQLAAIVRDLDAAGVRIADIALRQPTLDDVFLTLTGHGAEPISNDDDPPATREERDREEVAA
ncbi:MAG: ATP-binding cassette domain-containing protein [Dehalococcoidia bacterium]